MNAQLSLELSLRDDATFDNFLPVDTVRAQVKSLLEKSGQTQDHLIYLWGENGSGRSHLLQSICHHRIQQGESVQYLSMAEVIDFPPEILIEGFEQQRLICIEDIHTIKGNAAWEKAIFNLYNRLLAGGSLLAVSANVPPRSLHLELADLESRLSAGAVFHLSPYSHDDKRAITCFRANKRGLALSEDTVAFILNRCDRQIDELMSLLSHLDRESLKAKRKVTIPFVKEVLDG